MLYLVDVETGENLPIFLGSILDSADDILTPIQIADLAEV